MRSDSSFLCRFLDGCRAPPPKTTGREQRSLISAACRGSHIAMNEASSRGALLAFCSRLETDEGGYEDDSFACQYLACCSVLRRRGHLCGSPATFDCHPFEQTPLRQRWRCCGESRRRSRDLRLGCAGILEQFRRHPRIPSA